MKTLDKRNETYGLDLKIAADMAHRAEVMTTDRIAAAGTGVSVQELINLVCDLLDGEKDHDIENLVGPDMADRTIEIRKALRPLWTYPDGTKVVS